MRFEWLEYLWEKKDDNLFLDNFNIFSKPYLFCETVILKEKVAGPLKKISIRSLCFLES